MKKLFFSLISVLIFSSCFKEEIPVLPHEPGDVNTAQVNLDPLYKWQAYFDLGTNSLVSYNHKVIWDLGFNTNANGFEVILNGSKAMFSYTTTASDWTQVTDTNGFFDHRRMDDPKGNLDSTAIGDWRIDVPIYILDRGYNELGAHQGFKKFSVLSYNAAEFIIRFSDLSGANDCMMTVTKDTNYNFSFVSLTGTGSLVQVEPPKTTWDLCFSQYLEALETPYLVTGCLINQFFTSVAIDSVRTFEAITYQDVSTYSFSNEINKIGYDWKWYDFGASIYYVDPSLNYIIRDAENIYYKLHFIDFYDQSGNKGSPKFEFQQL